MPAEVRCTSSGALSTEGSARTSTRTAVVTKPSTPDQRAGDDIGPRLFHQPAGNGEHSERSRQLTNILRRKRTRNQVGSAVSSEKIGQEGIGDEIHCVDADEDRTEPPDQRTPPLGPPPESGRGVAIGALRPRRTSEDQ